MDFQLYSKRGNALAAKLFGGIADAVREDRLTRRQAMAAALDAIHDIDALGDGLRDGEPFDSIAHRLNAAFREAGYETVGGRELQRLYEDWSAGRAPSDPDKHFPDQRLDRLVRKACDATRRINEILGTLNAGRDIAVSALDKAPWQFEFSRDGDTIPDGLAVYAWRGDGTGNAQLGACLDAYELTDALAKGSSDPDLAAVQRTCAALPGPVREALDDLATAIASLNAALSDMNLPEAIRADAEGACVTLHNGDEILDLDKPDFDPDARPAPRYGRR